MAESGRCAVESSLTSSREELQAVQVGCFRQYKWVVSGSTGGLFQAVQVGCLVIMIGLKTVLVGQASSLLALLEVRQPGTPLHNVVCLDRHPGKG